MSRISSHLQHHRLGRLGARLSTAALALGLLLPQVAAAGSWEARSVAGMDVHVYTPDGVSPVGDGRGLMIVMHGCVQKADDLKANGNLEAGAEAFGVVMAVPQVPGGGVYAGCWDYYGAAHTRDNRHNDDLLALTDELSADAGLEIDPDQVYITGFSSGGGEALILGCLAPDVFAGAGIAAGPSVGTEAVQIGFVSTDTAAAAALCESLAAANAGDFSTQLAAVYAGTSDFTVAQDYATINAEMFALRYGGLSPEPGALDVAGLAGYEPAGEGTLWSDGDGPRIALIKATGGSHAWPAGSGAGGVTSFVEAKGVDYGSFLAEFFTTNNRRVDPVGEETTSTGGDSDSDGSGSDGTDGSGSGGSSDGSSGGSSASDSGSGGSSGSSDAGTGGSSGGGTDGSDSDASDSASDSASASATANYGSFGGGDDDGEGGCACSVDDPDAPGSLLGLSCFALGLLVRRRRSRA
ncbi:MAG: PHB depolymerase family esterase [Myxococcales bacterium]|nr:PHB depolymerase family esterase [Myxococcales bacterium]